MTFLVFLVAFAFPYSWATAAQENDDYYSAGDFYYYYRGEKVPLHRSLTQYVVKLKSPVATFGKASSFAAIRSLEVVKEIAARGETFSIVRVHRMAAQSKSAQEKRREVEETMAWFYTHPEVEFVSPLFFHPGTRARMFLTGEILVKLKPGREIEELLGRYASYGVEVKERLWGTQDEYVLRFQNLRMANPLDVANAISESGLVEWAEPNFVQEYRRSFTPNDPLFPQQWHLDNLERLEADVDAPNAWKITQGSPNIVIAIIDDGVELNHPDLVDNIFRNPRELLNGRDDDGNGFIDDIWGWDFVDNDNNPNPTFSEDNHGTAVAGVAAARGGNGIGVTGVCPFCTILPVRIGFFDFFDTFATAFAIRYAASLADVLNNSWGGGIPSSALQSAIRDAITFGRGGKGSVVLSAAGNFASGYEVRSVFVPSGTHRFRWVYSKNFTGSLGDDTAWLGWVVFPGGQVENFEFGASKWLTGGDAYWTIVNDPTHADEGACFTHALKAGVITHNQSTWVEIVKTVPAGEVSYFAWVSSELFDGLRLWVDWYNNGTFDWFGSFQSGVPLIADGVLYPAAFPESIAVGASTDRDCRAYYSQFGPELDLVEPSNGGPFFNRAIFTTDRTGGAGYDSFFDYALFGGTSSATPVAAGISALVLSVAPELTEAEVRKILQDTADKIGPGPYVGGRNDRYGYGRVNAFKAVSLARSSRDDHQSKVQKLYIAYYQRPADPSGLRFWAQRLHAQGGSLEGIIDAFATSPEAVALYDTNGDGQIDLSDASQLIDKIYQALFNRLPDAAGKQFYLNALQTGQFPDGRLATLGRVALDILNGAQGSDRVAINNKLEVARRFTHLLDPNGNGVPDEDPFNRRFMATYEGNEDAAKARRFLAQVTFDPSTVKTEAEIRDFIRANIADPGDPILR
ncbi:MAG: S8 family serine peptidase [Methylohalobius sp.]